MRDGGARVSTWENVVATLPNLSAMNSKTFVNEIDISKVSEGQKAEIEVDAFPGKKLTGIVHTVANMGEQLNNSNAKVFEVIIQVDGYDSILRPSMTTKNRIITEVLESQVYIPIECVQANDSINYVYKGSKKHQVIPGKSNENDIVILAGLEEGDEIYLEPPANAEKWSVRLLDDKVIAQYQQMEEVKEEPEKNEMSSQEDRPGRKGKGRRGTGRPQGK